MARDLRVGVDVGGTKIKAGLIGASGRVLRSVKVPTRAAKGKAAILAAIEAAVESVWRPGGRGIGLGLAGIVDYRRGIYLQGPNFPRSFRNVPVAALLKKRFGVPAVIDNDVHCFTLGEAKFGAGKGFSHVVGITLGTGIGGGVVIDGRLYRGRNNAAGEVGHMTIAFDSDVRCGCGRAGHFEAFASGPALSRLYAAKTGVRTDALGVERAAAEGNVDAKAVVATAAEALAAGLANVIHALNPDVIVVGGGLSAAGTVWRTMLSKLRSHIIFPELRDTPVVRSKMREDANIIGAAMLANE